VTVEWGYLSNGSSQAFLSSLSAVYRRFVPLSAGSRDNHQCAENKANSGRLRECRFYRFPGLCPGQAERPAVLAETPLFTGGSPNPLNLETESDIYE
jgi:hypothetical protein